jgi:CDP-paratose 2-epimerase
VDDLFNLVNLELLELPRVSGKIYNVGGGNKISLSLKEATSLCRQITGNKIKIGSSLNNRPGDIAIYLSDTRKVKNDLSWRPEKTAESILLDIYGWIRNSKIKLEKIR